MTANKSLNRTRYARRLPLRYASLQPRRVAFDFGGVFWRCVHLNAHQASVQPRFFKLRLPLGIRFGGFPRLVILKHKLSKTQQRSDLRA